MSACGHADKSCLFRGLNISFHLILELDHTLNFLDHARAQFVIVLDHWLRLILMNGSKCCPKSVRFAAMSGGDKKNFLSTLIANSA